MPPDVPSEVTVLLIENVWSVVPFDQVPPLYQPFQFSVDDVSVPPDEMV